MPLDPQFTATQNCAGGVAPGASCQYTFRFTPTSAGVFTTTSNSSTSAGPFVITLRGEGIGPSFFVSPQSLDFGYVPVGILSAPQVVTLTNTSPTTVTNFAGGMPPAPFTATQNCAGGVPPGGSCQYTFRFQPAALGRFTTTSNTSTNGGPFVIRLAGGVAPPTLGLTFEPGVADVGQSVTLRYVLTNTNASLATTGVAFNNTLPAGLQVASPANATASPECNGPTLTATPGSGVIAMANGAIAGGKSCVVTVQVKADVPGTFINAVAASAVNGGAGNAVAATLSVWYRVRLPLIMR